MKKYNLIFLVILLMINLCNASITWNAILDDKTITECGKCGKGIFNICDREECQNIEEGCFFLQKKFIEKCKPCSGASCEDYRRDEISCKDDVCGFNDCFIDGKKCKSCTGVDCETYAEKNSCEKDSCGFGNCIWEYKSCKIEKTEDDDAVCGNGLCEKIETKSSCPNDCDEITCRDLYATLEENCINDGWKKKIIDVDGIDREMLWKAPENGEWKNGAIIVMHGGEGVDSSFCSPVPKEQNPLLSEILRGVPAAKFGNMAVKEGFAVFSLNSAYNRATDSNGLPIGKRWDSFKQDDKENIDLDFIEKMIDETIPSLRPQNSQNEVFITGISNGGFMTTFASTQFNDKITAFAPVSSGDPYGMYFDMTTEHLLKRACGPGTFRDLETNKEINELDSCKSDSYPNEKIWPETKKSIKFKQFHHEGDGGVHISCMEKTRDLLVEHGYQDAGAFIINNSDGKRTLEKHFWQWEYSEKILEFFKSEVKDDDGGGDDDDDCNKKQLTCKNTIVKDWHYGKCTCSEGYDLEKCEETGWIFKRRKETCEKIYETECSLNPKCNNGDETISVKSCGEGCDDGGLGPGDYDFTLEHDGLKRKYLVHVPESYDKNEKVPMVLAIHGGGSNGELMDKQYGGLNDKADKEGFIVVYPNGHKCIDVPGNTYCWNAGTVFQLDFIDYNADDIGFISKVIDDLESKLNIDKKRIYATGPSNGAWMSFALACKLSDKIAAIAPIAGGMVMKSENCNPDRAVPIIQYHGTKDPGWPFYGGGSCWTDSIRPPISETIYNWKKLNQCSGSVITYQNGDVTCETNNCVDNSKYTFCKIVNGGHTIPGGYVFPLEKLLKWDSDCALGTGIGVGEVTQDISAIDSMWEFFEKHTLDDGNKGGGDDDDDCDKKQLTCKNTIVKEWHYGNCICSEGYNLEKCEETGWIFKRHKETCEKIYETECSLNPKCNNGDETISVKSCGEGCDDGGLGPGDYDFSLVHDGLKRKYLVHVPESYDKNEKVPMVLAIHGGGGNAQKSVEYFQMNDNADKEGFIVVYPEGTGKEVKGEIMGSWNTGDCCPPAMDNNVDDVGFIDKMLDDLINKFSIDEKRIYATGHSNGGIFSYKLACDLSNRIAAIAPVGAQDATRVCNPKRAVPVMHIHGTKDPCSPYEGGECGGCLMDFINVLYGTDFEEFTWKCSSVPDYIDKWKVMNECSDKSEITFQNNSATCITNNCKDNSEVTLCTFKGMGHSWPGHTEYGLKACKTNPDGYICKLFKSVIGPLSSDMTANDYIWKFFEKHTLDDGNKGGDDDDAICGNGICEEGEDDINLCPRCEDDDTYCSLQCMVKPGSCPEDCKDSGGDDDAVCGNGICEEGEDDINLCPRCEDNDTYCSLQCMVKPGSCPEDCKDSGGDDDDAVCGNGICEISKGETDENCLKDCFDDIIKKKSRLICRDIQGSITDWKVFSTECSENPKCPSGYLPVGKCDYIEENCISQKSVCGNSLCESGEDKNNCKIDCNIFYTQYNPRNYKYIIHDGKIRSYMIHVPNCYDNYANKEIPLVIALHGGSGTGETIQEQIGLNKKADEGCFIAVYPNAVSSVGINGKKQYFNVGPRDSKWYDAIKGVDDVGFISKMIDEIKNDYSIDSKKVYVTGLSNGAFMSYRLACELSDKIAAIAPIGGGMVAENCNPDRPVPIIHFHGKDDVFYPYNGGKSCLESYDSLGKCTGVCDNFQSVEDLIEKWKKLNGCSNTPEKTYENGEAVCQTYTCNENSEVTLCSIENGGHTIPDGYSYPSEKLIGVGKITRDINAAEEMWKFFEKHTLE